MPKTRPNRRPGQPSIRPGHKNGNVRLAIAGAAAGMVLFALGALLGGAALIVGAAAGIVLAGMAAHTCSYSGEPLQTRTQSVCALPERSTAARRWSNGESSEWRRLGRTLKRPGARLKRPGVSGGSGSPIATCARPSRPRRLPTSGAGSSLRRTHLGNVRTWQERIRAIGKDISGYTEDVVPLAQQFGIPFDESDARTIAAAADRLIELGCRHRRACAGARGSAGFAGQGGAQSG